MMRSDELPSLKRLLAEDSVSDGCTLRSSCRYEGCRRPGRLEKSGGAHHPFCSWSHREFFMSDLFEGDQWTEQSSGICKLPGCHLPLWVIDSTTGEAFDFCRRKHALTYIKDCAERWASEGRLCQFEPCTRHVLVQEWPKKIHDYCGLEHVFAAVAARGKQAAPAARQLPSLPQGPQIVDLTSSSSEIRGEVIFQEARDQTRGYHDKDCLEAIEYCLKHLFAHPGDFANADPDGLFKVVNKITEFLPFEEVTEFGGFVSKFFLHFESAQKGKRDRSIKDGFYWRQEGRPYLLKSTAGHLLTAYFFLELKTKDANRNDHCGDHVRAYRQYEEAKAKKEESRTRKRRKGVINRWKAQSFSLSDDIVNDCTGGIATSMIPVITKIFQERHGEPVWPRPQTSSVSSNSTSSCERLLFPGQALQGKNSSRLETPDVSACLPNLVVTSAVDSETDLDVIRRWLID